MKSLRLNPMSANQDLIPNLTAVSIPPGVKPLTIQSGITWSALVKLSAQQGLRRVILPETILHSLLIISFICLPHYYLEKTFLQLSSFLLLDGMLLNL